MGNKETKPAPVIKEQISVNSNIAPNSTTQNATLSTIEIFGLGIVAALTCLLVLKMLNNFLKKQIRTHIVNAVWCNLNFREKNKIREKQKGKSSEYKTK
jgi:hypothetical protein